ncbi:hypothetical protein DFJ69_6052 [Thermomonospora umbrina]|uniref:Uncharacterized protein n=2 Tax=Thermomonospora umbrina TaxID=111806 RepID=A0A3D9SY66_9ACTN|nr:hypothetical protein DFJ69_6052 [Thermomonospora umbrina]
MVSMLTLAAAVAKTAPVAGLALLIVGAGVWPAGRIGDPTGRGHARRAGVRPRSRVVPALGLAVTIIAVIALATAMTTLGGSGHRPLGDLGLPSDRHP